ncbi:MAG: transposase, partial [Clostridia bacterium]|nr:transposase [Clostridia bacterium]
GITVILTEESYTSGTSFIDDEQPVKEKYNKARRIKRGLFKSNNGVLINADLNGAYQIMKKVISIQWDRGCALHPFVVNIA